MEKAARTSIDFSKEQSLLMIKGIILGIGMIVPGISGGTILIAFGIYEKMINDLLKFRITPFLVMVIGAVVGIFGGSYGISYLFEFYRNPTSAFILGCLLMSIPFILKRSRGYSHSNLILFAIGCIVSFAITNIPALLEGGKLSTGHVFLAGFIASSTMMIPGVSGSAILIILGIYEEMLLIINELQMVNMMVFAIGALFGIFILAKILKNLFSTHGSQILFFFSGLILGSSRLLFPTEIDIISFLTFCLGIGLVYRWGNFKYKNNHPILGRTFSSIKNQIKTLFNR